MSYSPLYSLLLFLGVFILFTLTTSFVLYYLIIRRTIKHGKLVIETKFTLTYFAIVASFIVFYTLLLYRNLFYIIYLLFIAFLSIREYEKLLRKSCGETIKHKPLQSISSYEILVCKGDFNNAFYSIETRKIFIGSPLLRMLDALELKAIVLHEEGHAKMGKILNILQSMSNITLIFIFLPFIISIIIEFHLLNTDLLSYIALYLFFASEASLLLFLNWGFEFLADLNAINKGFGEYLASALKKMEIYSRIKAGYEIHTIIPPAYTSYFRRKHSSSLFLTLFLYMVYWSLKIIPLSIIDLADIKNKWKYLTHPPHNLRYQVALYNTLDQNK